MDHTVITTNGSLVNKEIIEVLEKINLGELFLQVSIDSPNKKEHDSFRQSPGAFEKAINAIKLTADSSLTLMIRTTIIPDQLYNMENMVRLADNYGVKRVSFGPVIPSGKAQVDKSLILDKKQKKKFIENILSLKEKYPDISISTEDPVKFSICSKVWDYGDFDYSRNDFIGGCSAGITNINILADGTITPCSMMLKPITNIKDKTPKEILKNYTSSKIIKNLIERNVKGKCKTCNFSRLCGGCRATAHGISDDYLAEDPTCWKQ